MAGVISRAGIEPSNWSLKDNYIKPLDGLRAMAVLMVLIFHAAPETLPGGFVGVDIFFVIF